MSEHSLNHEVQDDQHIAIVDIDGVLFDTPSDAVVDANEANGTNHSVDDIFNYNAEHNKELFIINGVDQFHKYQLDASRYRRVKDAKEGLELLVANGVKVIALTSRNYDMFYEITKQAIEEHFGDLVSAVHFNTEPGSEQQREKGEIVIELGGKVLLDDAVKYCESAVAHGRPAILLAQDYNRKDHSYPVEDTAEDWQHAALLILKKLGIDPSASADSSSASS